MGPAGLSPLPLVHCCRFTKFHSNDGSISHSEPCLQAFSHWTWRYWAQAAHPEEAVVVDLQGIKKGTYEFLLTDPAIHTCNTHRLVGLLCHPPPLTSTAFLTCLRSPTEIMATLTGLSLTTLNCCWLSVTALLAASAGSY